MNIKRYMGLIIGTTVLHYGDKLPTTIDNNTVNSWLFGQEDAINKIWIPKNKGLKTVPFINGILDYPDDQSKWFLSLVKEDIVVKIDPNTNTANFTIPGINIKDWTMSWDKVSEGTKVTLHFHDD